MSENLGFAGIPVFVDAGNLAFPPHGPNEPAISWLLDVVAVLNSRLPGARFGLILDGSIWGWMQRTHDQRDLARLRRLEEDGTLFITPKHTKADTYVLELARRDGGIAVSNDDFCEGDEPHARIGIPILRVGALFKRPEPHPRFLLYPEAGTKAPVEITNNDVIARHAPRQTVTVVDATAPTASAEPSDIGIADILGWLNERADANGRVNRNLAGSELGTRFGRRFRAFLKGEIGGPEKGRWIRLCCHLPGWRVESGSNGAFWLVRHEPPSTLSDPPAPVAPASVPPAPADHANVEAMDLATLLTWLDERLGDGDRLPLAETGTAGGCTFGPAWSALLAGQVGGSKNGRWTRFCQRCLPGWHLEVDPDRRRWLVRDPSAASASINGPTLADLCAHLEVIADGADRLSLDWAASLLAIPFGDGWNAFLGGVVGGGKQGRWTRLCRHHLPGWRSETDHDGCRWLVREAVAHVDSPPTGAGRLRK